MRSRLRKKLWRRTLKIYSYHLLMLAFAFTAAAAFAAETHRPALYNLLNFYLAHPVVAIIGSALLIYCPPLLDILPMYVIFLFLTPLALSVSARYGWRWVLAGSGLLWVAAQLGLRELCARRRGACDASADSAAGDGSVQPVCVAGGLGDRPVAGHPRRWRARCRWHGYMVQPSPLCGAVCAFFFEVRHGWLGPHLTQETLGIRVDKWQIGPLRLIGLAEYMIVW